MPQRPIKTWIALLLSLAACTGEKPVDASARDEVEAPTVATPSTEIDDGKLTRPDSPLDLGRLAQAEIATKKLALELRTSLQNRRGDAKLDADTLATLQNLRARHLQALANFDYTEATFLEDVARVRNDDGLQRDYRETLAKLLGTDRPLESLSPEEQQRLLR